MLQSGLVKAEGHACASLLLCAPTSVNSGPYLVMTSFFTSRLRCSRLILAALCLCLSVSSIAGALITAPHNMVPFDNTHHAAQPGESHGNIHVEHHNPNVAEQAHNCCDDGQDTCSISPACTAHCIASIAQNALHLFPATGKNGFETESPFDSPFFLYLDGPFKPPR